MHDIKYGNNTLVNENIVKHIKNQHLRAHFIISHNSSSVFIFTNEEKIVAIQVYTSFVRVSTSGFRIG